MSLQRFEAYLCTGWQDHASDPRGVAAGFERGLALLDADKACESKLPDLARLIEHTLLGHVGCPGIVEPWLDRLQSRRASLATSKIALQRMQLAAQVSQGRKPELPPMPDDQQLSGCANGLVAHCVGGDGKAALLWMDDFARELAQAERTRAKAMAGAMNSLSFHLTLFPLTELTCKVMLRAAALSRDAWVKVGHWRDIERAEHFLALSHVAAGDGASAIEHAHRCRQICAENQAPPYEFFFAAEALARGCAVSRDFEAARGAVHLMEQLLPDVTDACAQAHCSTRLGETREFISARSGEPPSRTAEHSPATLGAG